MPTSIDRVRRADFIGRPKGYLASTAVGAGSNAIGYSDAAGSVVASDVESVLDEVTTPLTLTPAAEAGNAIAVVVAGPAHVAQYVARAYDAAGTLSINYDLSETGVGAAVFTGTNGVLLFTTDVNGAATVTVTDGSAVAAETMLLTVEPCSASAGAKAGPGAAIPLTFA